MMQAVVFGSSGIQTALDSFRDRTNAPKTQIMINR